MLEEKIETENEKNLAINCKNVEKTFGEGNTAYKALRGINFQVHKGEFVMLSGPSGSGKTTLLSVIGCTLNSSSGTVKLFNNDVSKFSERERSQVRLGTLGFIFQSHNLLESLSAEENVSLVLKLRGWSESEASAEARTLLKSVNLENKFASLPKELSGGQKQRVAIARALSGKPPLILADEPTAALDAQNGLAVTENLKQLAKEYGHTVVVVTHDSRIFHLADRIVHIEDGLITTKVH
jgi:putative ABC transport system ATP-binding protein